MHFDKNRFTHMHRIDRKILFYGFEHVGVRKIRQIIFIQPFGVRKIIYWLEFRYRDMGQNAKRKKNPKKKNA